MNSIITKNALPKGVFLMFFSIMGVCTMAQSSLMNKGNPTFNIDCKGVYPKCAEDIVDWVEKFDILEVRKNLYYQNTNREYFYYQFKVSDKDYDTIFQYLKERDITQVSKLQSTSIVVRGVGSQDTTQIYFQMQNAKQEMERWKSYLDTTKLDDVSYNRYLSSYNRASRNYFSYKRNLENMRRQAKHPYQFTLMVYKDKSKYNTVNTSRRYTNKKEYKFTPSIAGGAFFPRTQTIFTGEYIGFQPELSLYTKWASYSRRSPAYVRIASGVGVYSFNGNAVAANRRYIYTIGGDASFENRINRKWMIPFFGMNAGFVTERNLGNSLFIQPKIGLLLFASKDVHIFGEGGYFFATQNSTSYEAGIARLGLNLMLWTD